MGCGLVGGLVDSLGSSRLDNTLARGCSMFILLVGLAVTLVYALDLVLVPVFVLCEVIKYCFSELFLVSLQDLDDQK